MHAQNALGKGQNQRKPDISRNGQTFGNGSNIAQNIAAGQLEKLAKANDVCK